MLRSMFSGVSGLQSNQTRMDVVGNNISNLNTTGFKKDRVTFSEMFNQTLRAASAPQDDIGGTNPESVGLGVGVGSIDTIHTTGNIETTGVNTDLAIDGDGYFVVNDGQQDVYTRDGNLDIDANGDLINSTSGYRVKGWTSNESGEINTSTTPEDITLPLGERMEASRTENAYFGGNLDSRVENGVQRNGSIDVIDSLGESHTANLDFVRQIGGMLQTDYQEIGDDGEFGIVQSAYDPNMQDLEFSFTQNDELEGINVNYYTGNLDIEANFDGAADLTPSDFEREINNTLEAQNYTGPIKLDLVDEEFENIVGDLDDLDDLTLTNPNFSGQNVNIVQDQENPDNELQGLDVQLGHDEDGGIPTASYSSDEHVVTLNGNFAHDDLDSWQDLTDIINDTLDESGFDGQIMVVDDEHVVLDEDADIELNGEDSQTFAMSAANHWDWNLDSVEGTIEDTTSGSGTLVFDSSGRIIEGQTGNIEFNPEEVGAPVQNVAIDFADDNNPVSQQATASSLDGLEADGYESGELTTFDINNLGQIVGQYTNGQNEVLGQVSVASFNNPEGLEKMGENIFAATENSGTPQIGEAGSGGRGSIASQSLEMSNVDLSEEFTNMIATQRGYQANSSLITTSDEMLQELVNLKR